MLSIKNKLALAMSMLAASAGLGIGEPPRPRRRTTESLESISPEERARIRQELRLQGATKSARKAEKRRRDAERSAANNPCLKKGGDM